LFFNIFSHFRQCFANCSEISQNVDNIFWNNNFFQCFSLSSSSPSSSTFELQQPAAMTVAATGAVAGLTGAACVMEAEATGG
jgi:hypothetical protein